MPLPGFLIAIGTAVANTVRKVAGRTTVTIGGQQTNSNSNQTMQTEQTAPKPEIIKGVPNMFLLIGGAIAAYFLFMGKPRRR